jgi:hypothetical protein
MVVKYDDYTLRLADIATHNIVDLYEAMRMPGEDIYENLEVNGKDVKTVSDAIEYTRQELFSDDGLKSLKDMIKDCSEFIDDPDISNEYISARNGLNDFCIARVYNSLRDSGKYDKNQLGIIKKSFEQGLTTDQVAVFADPEFSPDQMNEFRRGFEHGLSENQVRTFANPKYDADQIYQICAGFVNRLSSDQVAVFADPKFDSEQMKSMRMKLEEQNAHKHEVQPERTSVRVKPPVQRTGKSR